MSPSPQARGLHVRFMDAEQDILEGQKTYLQIALDNGFKDIQGLHDELLRQGRRDLLAKARVLPGGRPPEPPPARRPAPPPAAPVFSRREPAFKVAPEHRPILEEAGIVEQIPEKDDIAGTRQERLEDLLESPDHPTPSPTREEPVVAQQTEDQPAPPADKSGYKLANGATEHRDGRAITYGERVWSYLEAALQSPKKRTAAKATRLQQQFYELIDLVDEEAEEVKALKEIEELEAQLAVAKAKLKPAKTETPAASNGHAEGRGAQVRAWARENGFDVPDRGKLSGEVYAAYDAAHESESFDE